MVFNEGVFVYEWKKKIWKWFLIILINFISQVSDKRNDNWGNWSTDSDRL